MDTHATTSIAGARGGPPPIEVFSACPVSIREGDRPYVDLVAEHARWSERHGCSGMLIYTDNRLVDPWMVTQLVLQATERLHPLVAVQPAYAHPYTVANHIATAARLYGRRLFINWVAGGFKKDLEALGDPTPHDERYERLVEYASLVRRLTNGESVTHDGSYFQVRALELQPPVPWELRPEFVVSGSSEAGRAAGEVLGARSVTYALAPDEGQDPPHRTGLQSGLRIGVIAREDRQEAWLAAHERFPPSREGALMRQLARQVSDSEWHAQLCRLAEESADEAGSFWMVPFENYQTMCPYLVGTHGDVAAVLEHYVSRGFGTFILDEPEAESDVAHALEAFRLAANQSMESV